MPAELKPSREAIRAFLNALFLHASGETYISLRAFRDDVKDAPPLFATAVRIDDPEVVDRSAAAAAQAAAAAEPHVFCPPVCTFHIPNGAKLEHLAEGVALSVELDTAPDAGLAKLREVLGKPTCITTSGGEWRNPTTGRLERKRHAHYRLVIPTRSSEEHERLREARELACRIAGGDASCIAIVHP